TPRRLSVNKMQDNKDTKTAKKRELFLQQKQTLDTFLERGAIDKRQYEKSLGDLRLLMGMQDVE
ncbi:MAG: hypothetical protein J6I80_02065, partial [Clostridia bacterium]|nr:hypothetical protein [Clostridia bacterium]